MIEFDPSPGPSTLLDRLRGSWRAGVDYWRSWDSIAALGVLRAPWPAFGGKSRAAALVWERFGDADVYIEPCSNSAAVLLGRPRPGRVETVNDLDPFIANAWRAIKWAPLTTARYADWPVNEADLHARHHWLVHQIDRGFGKRIFFDPHYYHPKIAGWWIWGLSQWIGRGWCQPTQRGDVVRQLPEVSRPSRRRDIYSWFLALQQRLRWVRVCCGDWHRVVSPAVLFPLGLSSSRTTAVFLDPPYKDASKGLYFAGDDHVADRIREWAIENGQNPHLRIALCGMKGEHEMPSDWECVSWSAPSGYAAIHNPARERIWFSPYCLRGRQLALFPQEGDS